MINKDMCLWLNSRNSKRQDQSRDLDGANLHIFSDLKQKCVLKSQSEHRNASAPVTGQPFDSRIIRFVSPM